MEDLKDTSCQNNILIQKNVFLTLYRMNNSIDMEELKLFLHFLQTNKTSNLYRNIKKSVDEKLDNQTWTFIQNKCKKSKNNIFDIKHPISPQKDEADFLQSFNSRAIQNLKAVNLYLVASHAVFKFILKHINSVEL